MAVMYRKIGQNKSVEECKASSIEKSGAIANSFHKTNQEIEELIVNAIRKKWERKKKNGAKGRCNH